MEPFSKLVFIALALGISFIGVPRTPVPTSIYDREIKEAASKYLPQWEWDWYKAQLYQESLLNTNAVSGVGARGIAQFMPATWKEVSKDLQFGERASPHSARLAIQAGAYYDFKMRSVWNRGNRTEGEKRSLALASYNTGAGNVLAAQQRCKQKGYKDCDSWIGISSCLREVTGPANSKQTIEYVERIALWRLKWKLS